MSLWGTSEVCSELGITKATLGAWRRSKGFPAPLLTLKATPVWDAIEVRAWLADRKSATAGRHLQLIRLYRQYGRLKLAADEVGISIVTARRWLREHGEPNQSELKALEGTTKGTAA